MWFVDTISPLTERMFDHFNFTFKRSPYKIPLCMAEAFAASPHSLGSSIVLLVLRSFYALLLEVLRAYVCYTGGMSLVASSSSPL